MTFVEPKDSEKEDSFDRCSSSDCESKKNVLPVLSPKQKLRLPANQKLSRLKQTHEEEIKTSLEKQILMEELVKFGDEEIGKRFSSFSEKIVNRSKVPDKYLLRS